MMLDKGKSVDIVYLDFSKLSHKALCRKQFMKLYKYSIDVDHIEWISNWLVNDRKVFLIDVHLRGGMILK